MEERERIHQNSNSINALEAEGTGEMIHYNNCVHVLQVCSLTLSVIIMMKEPGQPQRQSRGRLLAQYMMPGKR